MNKFKEKDQRQNKFNKKLLLKSISVYQKTFIPKKKY